MNNFNKNSSHDKTIGFECIDQDLGSNMWRLDVADTAPELKSRLETHLSFCADCRIQRRITLETARGLSEGHLQLPGTSRVNSKIISRTISTSGFLALAASLFLMFMLAPVAPQDKMAVRGGDEALIITSPVADEVLYNSTPFIRWHAVPEATSYNVRIEGVGNAYKWEINTSLAEIQIPAENILPISQRFRVFVEPVPAYLAPAGGWRSSFSTASLLPFVKYRIGAAPPEARSLALFALGLLVMGALTPLIWKRRLSI